LPVLNGLEATKRIRQMEINTPIIAQTAFSLDDDKMKSMEAGCNDYITKPVSQTELLTKINKLLKPSL
jgi:CheY-like chemotaxis protein